MLKCQQKAFEMKTPCFGGICERTMKKTVLQQGFECQESNVHPYDSRKVVKCPDKTSKGKTKVSFLFFF